MTLVLKRQWFEPDDTHHLIGLDPVRAGRWVGTYWYPCPYEWHRHVFHDAHTEADVVAADEWCEAPGEGQLQFPRPARGERRVDGHVLDPVPTESDHHFRDGRRVIA